MKSNSENRDPVEILAEAFLEELREGKNPSVEDYIERHPQWADRIRTLFPTLLLLEKSKNDSSDDRSGKRSKGKARVLRHPELLGEYRIVREIGSGGMGVVYEALQETLGRHVALKVLSDSCTSSPHAVERFRREAQAAARLHHTNIVPVFDIGEHEGHFYYVMQYIEGYSLDHLLSGLQAASGLTKGDFSLTLPMSDRIARSIVAGRFGSSFSETSDEKGADSENLVELDSSPKDFGLVGQEDYFRSVAGIGRQAAGALDYAHRQGTLHRDIKPANLLLDQQGTVWITDFGLAKFTEQEDLTRSGDMVGTLRYMAPEQFDGRADARSDVYNLGLTLYELLTLRPAYQEKSYHRLVRQVAEGTPPQPRHLNRAIPRDLETVVLKAMARHPKDRYATAGEMADDLQRFLDDRPIRARRISSLERFWRWCRRNRALAATASLALLLTWMITVVASIGYYRTADALQKAEVERVRAEANLNLAIEAFEDIFNELSGVTAADSLGIEENALGNLTPDAMVTEKEAELMETLLSFYDRFIERNHEDENLRLDTAKAYARVGTIQAEFGRLEEASEANEHALKIYQNLVGNFDDPVSATMEAVEVANRLTEIYSILGDREKAEQKSARAFDLLDSLSETAKLTRRARFHKAKSLYQNVLIFFHDSQRRVGGHSFFQAKDESLKQLQKLLAASQILDKLIAENPEVPEYQLLSARIHSNLGRRFSVAGQKWEAEESRERATEMIRELVRDHPENTRYRNFLSEILLVTSVDWIRNRVYDDSLTRVEEALRETRTLADRYPQVPRYRFLQGVAHFLLGRHHQKNKRFDLAEENYQLALACGSRFAHLSRKSRLRPHVQFSLAEIYLERGESAKACELLAELMRDGEAGDKSHGISLWEKARELLARAKRHLAERPKEQAAENQEAQEPKPL